MTEYKRESRTPGVTVRWHPEEPIPDGSGGTIHPAHGRATALVNVLGVAKSKVTHPDYVADVTMEQAEKIVDEYQRLVKNPSYIDTGIVSP